MKILALSIPFLMIFILFALPPAFAQENDTQWYKQYVIGKFTNSNPVEPDQIFAWQYRMLNGHIDNITYKEDDIYMDITSGNNGILEIKFPRNYPVDIADDLRPIILESGRGDPAGTITITSDDCFVDSSIPVVGNTTLRYVSETNILENLPIKSFPIPSHCIPDTVATDLPPIQQINAGLDPMYVTCNDGYSKIFHPDKKTIACVTSDTAQALMGRGWVMALAPQTIEPSNNWLTMSVQYENGTYSKFRINYTVTSGDNLRNVILGTYPGISTELYLSLQAKNSGILILTLPRTLIDSKTNGTDDAYLILKDGWVNYQFQEIHSTETDRTLQIPFQDGTLKIQISGNKPS